MKLFLIVQLRDSDDAAKVIEALCDTLTNCTVLKTGEQLDFVEGHNCVLVFRSFPMTVHKPLYEGELEGGD